MVVNTSDVHVTSSPIELDELKFDELCLYRGAKREKDRAALVDVHPRTLQRWREGTATPTLAAALTAATNLDTTVNDLWQLRKKEEQ